jgi:PAS domain-containing protein
MNNRVYSLPAIFERVHVERQTLHHAGQGCRYQQSESNTDGKQAAFPAFKIKPRTAESLESLESLVTSLSVLAYLLDRQWNAVVWNRAAAKLLKPWLEDSRNRNLLRFLFLSPAAEGRAR